MPTEIIKVCGITSVADAAFAAQRGATAVGFVFFAGSPREVRIEMAAMLGAVVPKSVLKVGVFVNEDSARIRATAAAARLDVVQLHGDESAEFCASLKDMRVWKALRVGLDFSAVGLDAYPCEAFLLDADIEGGYGGSGQTFPWPIAREVAKVRQVIVAGGLGGDNVAEAIRQVAPWGVDASSRLERKPGVKDPDKVQQYIEAAQAAE